MIEVVEPIYCQSRMARLQRSLVKSVFRVSSYEKALLLKHWICGRRNGVAFLDLVDKVWGPSFVERAKTKIDRIDTDRDDYILVYLKCIELPLYLPKELGLLPLYTLIEECCCKDSWHFYETPETQVAIDDTVIDCGASEGIFSLMVAPRCQKVYCVEPLPAFAQSLAKTFQGVDNVEIVPFAASDIEGSTAFLPLFLGSRVVEKGNGITVKTATIDSLFCGTRVDYIKIDVEGHEIKLLEGARRVLEINHPKLAVAVYHHRNHAQLISRYLRQINPSYRISLKGIYPEDGRPVLLHAWIQP